MAGSHLFGRDGQEHTLYPKNGSWNEEKPFVLSKVEA
jgi:hypothetical protein